ncbi:MAG: tetratricopeptide repeat protein [Geobacteraceae bacterium]|nr:tetratricopeptide repeat protein [Geobacteraceae bacterium]
MRLIMPVVILLLSLLSGCVRAHLIIDADGPVYYPKTPQGASTVDAAEKELSLLLQRSPVRIIYHATAKFPNLTDLKNYVDNTKPSLGKATHLWYQPDDPILQIDADGIDISQGKMYLPIFPLYLEELPGKPITLKGKRIQLPNSIDVYVIDGVEKAQTIMDYLYFIQKEMESERRNHFADFEKKATVYRGLPTKPQMGEEQRKLVVQANAFTQQKNYDMAIEKYLQAIKLDSTSYPAAYYNLALLYAQTNNPYRAVFHMEHYLLLEPDAKDARSARDKIYEWEGLLQK